MAIKYKVGDRVRFNEKLLQLNPEYAKCMDIIGEIAEISGQYAHIKKGPRTDGKIPVRDGGVGYVWNTAYIKLARPDEDEYGEVCP